MSKNNETGGSGAAHALAGKFSINNGVSGWPKGFFLSMPTET